MASSTYAAIIALTMGALGAGCGGESGDTSSSGAGGAGGASGSGSTSGAGTTSSNGSSSGSSGSTSSTTSGSSSSSSGGGMNTPCAGPKCDVTVIGTAFNMENGQTVHLGFVKQGGKFFDFESSAVVANGTFTIMGPQALTKGAAYNMNYYADTNNNGLCDQTPTDEVWRISLAPVMENLVISVVHNMNYSNIGCGGF